MIKKEYCKFDYKEIPQIAKRYRDYPKDNTVFVYAGGLYFDREIAKAFFNEGLIVSVFNFPGNQVVKFITIVAEVSKCS